MSRTITVSSAADLKAALATAGSGDTILLGAGDYGKLSLNVQAAFGSKFTAPVTIAAADPGNPPVFSELKLDGAANLSFENITFDYTFKSGDPLYMRNFSVNNSKNIAFEGCTFDGDTAKGVSAAANGFPTGVGLSISKSTGVSVENCELSGFWKGLTVANTNDLRIVENDIHAMRSDGMTLAGIQKAVIEGNHIHDFSISPLSGDHADMIQILTAGTTRPSTDVVIRGNTLDIGEGLPTQSIWIRNEVVDTGKAGKEMYYQRFTIEDNVIVNGHTHGIAVGEVNGLIIRNNSVLHADGANADGADIALEIPRISVAPTSTKVTITQNATSDIIGYDGQTGWTVTKNAIVQDQNVFGPGWYGDVFVATSLLPVNGAHHFTALPGGLLDRLDAGASATLTQPTSTTLDADFHVSSPVPGGQIRDFDASLTLGPQPVGTTYLWSFGDGTTATGETVRHTYGGGGAYDVTLTVRLPDGRQDTETLQVGVEGSELVRLDDSGAFATYSQGQETFAPISYAVTNLGLQLGGNGIVASVARADVATMLATDDVTIALTLATDMPQASGEVMRLHNSFVLIADAKGALVLRATSSLGQSVVLKATDVQINDMKAHDIEVRLDSGHLQLWVDGKLGADTAFAGTFADAGRHDLTFGNPWSTGVSADLSHFEISVNDGSAPQAVATDPFTHHHALDLALPLM